MCDLHIRITNIISTKDGQLKIEVYGNEVMDVTEAVKECRDDLIESNNINVKLVMESDGDE